MERAHSITNTQKGKHLTLPERKIIQHHYNKHKSITEIAEALGRSYNTIKNELKRGKILKYNGRQTGYNADIGNDTYLYNRENCKRHYSLLAKRQFIEYFYSHFAQGWSCDACVGKSLESKLFKREDIVCTKTLYNAISKGIICIKPDDLPEKMRRKRKKKHTQKTNRRHLGRSIEERPKQVATREEFGHWEADLVVGGRGGKKVLLTLLERKTRWYVTIAVSSRETKTVVAAVKEYLNRFGILKNQIFKTITTDNGSEFTNLSELEKTSKTLIYFTHPYSAFEKGANERHNRLLRRYIPKGTKIENLTDEYISQVTKLCNRLPRKILGYSTPEELFYKELQSLQRKS